MPAIAERAADAVPEVLAAGGLTRALLAVFAFGIAADVVIVSAVTGAPGQASAIGSAVLGAPLALAAAWHIATTGRLRATTPPLNMLMLFVAWSALTVFWANSPNGVYRRLITNVQLLALVLLAWQIIRTREDLKPLLWGYSAGCVVVIALTWRAYFAGQFIVWQRYAPAHFDPNDMCVYLALAIPMTTYLAQVGGWLAKCAALLYLPAAVSGVALSGSRGGLATIGVAIAGVVLWVALRSRTTSVILVAVLAGSVVVAGTLVPVETWSRMFTLQDELQGSAGGRVKIWSAGLKVLAEHPLLGVGAGGFERSVVPTLNEVLVAHSTPLSIGVELGLVGIVLFYGAFALVLDGARRRGLNEQALAWILVVTVCVGSLALGWETRKPMWVVLLLGAVLGALPPQRDATRFT